MNKDRICTTFRIVASAACVLAVALACAGCAESGVPAGSDAGGITVSASSETKVIPDKARISISVVTEEKDAEACQAKNADTTNKVIEALTSLGTDEKSIQTSYSDLSPRYGSRTADETETSAEDGAAYDEWVITGYEMNTTLTVSDLEIDNVGTTVQACIAAGANGSDGVEYYASDYDEKYNESLARALETAHTKAESIAASTGARLGKVTSVVEGYQDTSARYVANDMELEGSADSAGSAAKTMPGQVGITAQVTVTYAID